MAKPTKKRVKSDKEVVAEAKRKKEILDKVSQSNLPTKTILKELGISRSTYYSWLKRYEEEGENGLIDSRSLSKEEDQKEEAVPSDEEVETRAAVKVEPEDIVEETPLTAAAEQAKEEEGADLPPPEETVVEPYESVAPPAAEQPLRKEAEVGLAKEDVSFGGGQQRKGFGAYALIAVILLVLGLLFSLSLSNFNTYKLRKSSDTLTLWRGKFAPRGYEMVESFDPVPVGDTDVSELTKKTYTGKSMVYQAVFSLFMDEANMEAAKGNEADIGKINKLLDKAESIMGSDSKKRAGVTTMRFQLAKQRVTMAELAVQKAYQQALPVYQEALRAGLADSDALQSKVDAMKKALGKVPVVAPEEPSKKEVETPAEAEKVKEEAEIVAPAATEAQKVETSVAPKEEVAAKEEEAPAKEEEAPAKEEEAAAKKEEAVTGARQAETQKSETQVGPETSTKEDEAVSGEPQSGTADKPDESGKNAKKPTSFMEWVRSKRSQK